EQAVAAQQFREDLFYRLNVVRIHIRPLRERREDIRLLVNYFLRNFARDQQRSPKSISEGVIKALERYHWPGNVRELENAIRRALVMAKGDALMSSDLPGEITAHVSSAANERRMPTSVGEGTVPEVVVLARQLFAWARKDPKLKII